MQIRPKNIIVVGGGSGIGLATAQKLLDNGVDSVILASTNIGKLENALKCLRFSPRQKVYIHTFDITDCQNHERFIQNCDNIIQNNDNRFVDGLVISSGINFSSDNWKGFNISEDDYDKVMNTNLKGVFFLMRNFSNHLYDNIMKGNICIVSSISAHRDLLSVYQISKSAISGIVHAYGKYLCERGIILNCVEPGTTNTDMMKSLSGYTDGIRPGKEWPKNSIRRLIRPEEIADIICFLMSDLGEVMSGTCILASGGCKGIFK